MPLKDDVKALAGLKRTRPNFEKIQEQITELREMSDTASTALSAVDSAREGLQELSDALDEASDDNPVLGDVSALRDQVTDLLAALPGGDDSMEGLVSEAETAAEEYEECMDDTDFDREGREEVWGALCDALDNIADALT